MPMVLTTQNFRTQMRFWTSKMTDEFLGDAGLSQSDMII
jgi:hypothetical protein